MREFTNNEKVFIRDIASKNRHKEWDIIGDVLCRNTKISCIYKMWPSEGDLEHLPYDAFDDLIVQHCYETDEEAYKIVYEILLLVKLLEKEGYIYLQTSCVWEGDNRIGEYDKQKSIGTETRIDGFLPKQPIWTIVNKSYLATNAFVDLAKDFRTPEQRRYDITIWWTRVAGVCSFIAMLVAIASIMTIN